MNRRVPVLGGVTAVAGLLSLVTMLNSPSRDARAGEAPASSYAPVVARESFEATVKRMVAAKPQIAQRHMSMLKDRYDLSDRPAAEVTMS